MAGSGAKLSQGEIDALIARLAGADDVAADQGDRESEAPAPAPVAERVPSRPLEAPRVERLAGGPALGLDERRAAVRSTFAGRIAGRVARVMGHQIGIRGLRLRVGELVSIDVGGTPCVAEVIGLDDSGSRAMVFGETGGIGKGDLVTHIPEGHRIVVGPQLLGRVIDAHGRPLDGGAPIGGMPVALGNPPPPPLQRRRISEPLPMGVRVLDALCTAGRGQRVGLFGGSGVGKSTLLGMMARGTAADVSVVALIGERGREVREFLEDDLGPEGLARSVVVVATSDQPPLVRLRAGDVATRVAEWFADRGDDVLLLLDSLTRLAMAQREVGLAAGEPPTARGYTPSVFSMLPSLLERAGPREKGTVTGYYTVLVEGDDMNDPIADAARSILDGHVVLDRRLAVDGRYPAVDPLSSLSRLASKVVDPASLQDAVTVRSALAALEEVRDLVEVGAYVSGTNPVADRALAHKADLLDFLRQDAAEQPSAADTWDHLAALASRLGPTGGRDATA